ncbi:DUF1403 family protein [Maritimibacter sp. DP1N21-5]|uniref:DUF1403 family protein n=1 Tax=Maritimibacter sp. DP1N21-5 TaxID=2836867 RepID=UPI001C464E9A|nr:DUF1403 family protein [Maritimibacter sp. DP1N21-5]MBV7407347.1 DUF1403 family protein [Maritimibacter sp. DP1N21-5]
MLSDDDILARQPGWVTRGGAESLEDVAFLSGAALARLDLALRAEGGDGRGAAQCPGALLRDRRALAAAEVAVRRAGRRETARELRDAVHFTQEGDSPGPAGEVLSRWQAAVARPIGVASLARVLPGVDREAIAEILDRRATGGPVAQAAAGFAAMVAAHPGDETGALILAEAVLARALGWSHILPVLSIDLRPRAFSQRGDDLQRAFHVAVRTGALATLGLASELGESAARLREVAPKLRAKTSDEAVAIFLRQDAVAPAALPMPDRAARRLCDRLVSLGAVRELTGRDSFRLYGL